MQRPEYQNVFAISQSAIKAFKYKSIQKFRQIYIDKEPDDDDQDKFAFGSLVDTLAFSPDLLNKRFFIPDADITIPGEKVKLIVDNVYKEAFEIVKNKRLLNTQGKLPEPIYVPDIASLEEWRDTILKYAKEIKFGGGSWKDSRILDTVINDGHAYFRMLEECNNRIIITPIENMIAIAMVNSLITSPDTAKYFVPEDGTTLLFQQEIFIDYFYNDAIIPLKAALDIIRFDHINRTVQVPDLKTTYSSDDFKRTAKSFDYVTQASFYNYLIIEFIKTYEGGQYKDYKVELPINIVIDKDFKVPYIYEYDWDDIEIAKVGSKEHNFKGWMEVLNEIAWHIETGIWDRPREMHEKGKIKLKIFE